MTDTNLIRVTTIEVPTKHGLMYQPVIRSNTDNSIISYLATPTFDRASADLEGARQWTRLTSTPHANRARDLGEDEPEDDLDDSDLELEAVA